MMLLLGNLLSHIRLVRLLEMLLLSLEWLLHLHLMLELLWLTWRDLLEKLVGLHHGTTWLLLLRLNKVDRLDRWRLALDLGLLLDRLLGLILNSIWCGSLCKNRLHAVLCKVVWVLLWNLLRRVHYHPLVLDLMSHLGMMNLLLSRRILLHTRLLLLVKLLLLLWIELLMS